MRNWKRMIMLLFTAITMTGCGKKELNVNEQTVSVQEKNKVTENDSAIEEIKSESSTEKESECTTSEEDISTESEENSALLEESSFTFDIEPNKPFSMDTVVIKEDFEKPEMGTVTVSLSDILTTESDKEGFKIVSVTETINLEGYKSCSFNGGIVDYYTGLKPNLDATLIQVDEKQIQLDNPITVEYEGNTYDIVGAADFIMGDDGIFTLSLSALVPDEYEGTVFYVGPFPIEEFSNEESKVDEGISYITDDTLFTEYHFMK